MKHRQNSGSQFIELAAGLFVLIPLLLYGINASMLVLGSMLNADYCREACRAAADGPPFQYAGSSYTPKERAQRVLRTRYDSQAFIRVSPECAVQEQIYDPKPDPAFGGPVKGIVTITTTVKILALMPLPGFPQNTSLQATQSFPYTWMMPRSFAETAAGETATRSR